MPIEQIEGFREQKVESGWIESFNDFCKKRWEDFDDRPSEGESLREVQTRNIRALGLVLEKGAEKPWQSGVMERR